MAAVVVEIRVKPGQQVKAGDSLLTLSAMKMTSSVSAPKAGKVVRVAATVDQAVRVGDLLVELDFTEEDAEVDIPSQI
jgi:pyruvate carboxylase